MNMVMMNLRASTPPTIDELKERFNLRDEEIDMTFGVIEVDPVEGVYTVRVDESKVSDIFGDMKLSKLELEGPFSDPKIEPFGPVDS